MSGPEKYDIGGLTLGSRLWLAPMAGLTIAPVREFFSRLGAGLTHTEMVSCSGLIRGNRKTEEMLKFLPEGGEESGVPVILQLFSGSAGTMAQGAEKALEAAARMGPRRFAALGINMACPMPKVTKHGAGAALMRAPQAASEMTRGLKNLGLPVWVKIRRMSEASETLRFVETLLGAGADNVCIHGRTPAQRYEGQADRASVAAAAGFFPGKISASGDVYSPADVKEYLDMDCVGVMIARGALGNPFLFPQASRAIGRNVAEELANPAPAQKLEWLKNLGEGIRETSGSRMAVVLLKRFLAGVLKGTRGAAELRRRAGVTTDLEALLKYLEEGIARQEAG